MKAKGLSTAAYIIAFSKEHINHTYYNDMFVIVRFVCTGFLRIVKPTKELALDVMRLLHEYGKPQLWHVVSHHIVSNGKLDISDVITVANFPDLEFILRSGETRDVTFLE